MPTQKTLHDVFLDELRDVYHAEHQVTKALPKMIKKAGSADLRSAFRVHLDETRGQIKRLEKAFKLLDLKPRGVPCEGMAGILKEGNETMQDGLDGALLDAALIAAAQRVEHYETAAYGTLAAWAKTMGHDEVATLLEETLNEEKNADTKLSQLAESGINQSANGGEVGTMPDASGTPTRALKTARRSMKSNGSKRGRAWK
jgi:ferritin-like metal-binding protein YciE